MQYNNAVSSDTSTLQEDRSDETAAALRTTYNVASVGIATLNMLETLLPAAAGEVERESMALSEHFTTLVERSREQSATIDKIVHHLDSVSYEGAHFSLSNFLPLIAVKFMAALERNLVLSNEVKRMSDCMQNHVYSLNALKRNADLLQEGQPAEAQSFYKRVSQVAGNAATGIAGAVGNAEIMQLSESEIKMCEADLENTQQMAEDIAGRSKQYHSLIKREGEAFSAITEAAAGIVTCMQFQDRNTQIMQNVVCILERYRTMLEDICGSIDAVQNEHVASNHNLAEAVESILSGIRLSDIRARYMDALKKAKVPTHHSGASVIEDKVTDDIELF